MSVDKQTVVHSYNGILLSSIKKWGNDRHNNMDESWKFYAEFLKSQFPNLGPQY